MGIQKIVLAAQRVAERKAKQDIKTVKASVAQYIDDPLALQLRDLMVMAEGLDPVNQFFEVSQENEISMDLLLPQARVIRSLSANLVEPSFGPSEPQINCQPLVTHSYLLAA